jgi:hypothetical protein
MANPATRDGLIDYCKRSLGEPVIEINIDPDQVEDRVDEAIQFWQEFHTDATYRTYVATLIGDSDVTNEYVTVDTDVLYVTRMFRISGGLTGTGMFSLKYQFMLNNAANMGSFTGDLAHYTQMKQYMEMLDQTLNGTPQIEYVRKMNRLYVVGDFADTDIIAGDYVVYEALKLVDPSTNGAVYNDLWLKRYTTALIKRQWGVNLLKFEGMQLPGGVQLNGRQMFDDANNEIQALEEQMRSVFEDPCDFYVG